MERTVSGETKNGAALLGVVVENGRGMGPEATNYDQDLVLKGAIAVHLEGHLVGDGFRCGSGQVHLSVDGDGALGARREAAWHVPHVSGTCLLYTSPSPRD